MKARLKKRYPKDHRKRARWLWHVRTPTTYGETWESDTIGCCCESLGSCVPKD